MIDRENHQKKIGADEGDGCRGIEVKRSEGDEEAIEEKTISRSADQYSGDLEASASSTFGLERKLVQAALSCNSSNGVQSFFSFITPSGIFQVIIVGGGGGGFIRGGAPAAGSGGGGITIAVEAPTVEENVVVGGDRN